jgi:RNA polymerase sigma-70 factor (sigma-E family)
LGKRIEERLGELYSRHAREAIRLAFVLTGDADAAEDLVQEAFVRLHARFKDRGSPDALYPYLRRTIINLSRDRLRKLRSERAYIASQAPASASFPERPKADLSHRFALALQELPHRQKVAIVLRYLEDLSEQQTADFLGCSVPAVKQLVARGSRALRETMTEETK